jgi:hypothetical protein
MYEGRLIEADKQLAGLRNHNEHLQKELAGLGNSPNLKVVSKGYIDVLNDSEPSARSSALQKDSSRSGMLKQPKSQLTEEERYSDVFFEDEAEGSEDSDDHEHVRTVPDQDEDDYFSQDGPSPSESEGAPSERRTKLQHEPSQSSKSGTLEASHEESYEPSQAESRHRTKEASSSRSESIDDSFGGESDNSMD